MGKAPFLLLLSLGLVACSSIPSNVPADYQVQAGDDKGLVVMSLTYSGTCGFSHFLRMHAQGRHVGLLIPFDGHADWTAGDDVCPIAKERYTGRLVVLELPAGRYDIDGYFSLTLKRKFYPDENPPITVTVRAGQAVYVGNFHVHIGDTHYVRLTGEQTNRDLELLQKRYPRIDQRLVKEDSRPMQQQARRWRMVPKDENSERDRVPDIEPGGEKVDAHKVL